MAFHETWLVRHGFTPDLDGRLASIEGQKKGDLVSISTLSCALQSHEQAVLTQDRPITAMVAVAVAHWLQAVGSSGEAARMLGIGARLRGSDDPTSLLIAALTEELRAELGAEFDRRYAEGLTLDPSEAVPMVDPARYSTTTAGALG